jgi:hypothetical protein
MLFVRHYLFISSLFPFSISTIIFHNPFIVKWKSYELDSGNVDTIFVFLLSRVNPL